MTDQISTGDGYAVGSLEAMGSGPGFRKVRQALQVTAFGVNAIVMPPGIASGRHFHDEQEELYFVHAGTLEIAFGDGSTHTLTAGGFARVDAATIRSTRNPSDSQDAVYVIVGGKGGYVGRDGRNPDENEPRVTAPGA